MALKPPSKNAIPTKKGWVSPKGELLKSQKISQAQLDEYFGVTVEVEEAPAEKVEAEPKITISSDDSLLIVDSAEPFPMERPAEPPRVRLSSKSRAGLIAYAKETYGVDLDPKLTHAQMVLEVGNLQVQNNV